MRTKSATLPLRADVLPVWAISRVQAGGLPAGGVLAKRGFLWEAPFFIDFLGILINFYK